MVFSDPLPMTGPPPARPAAGESAPALAAPLRVLVLDDETMLLRLFARVLAPPPSEAEPAAAAPGGGEPADAPRFEVTACVQAEQAVAAVRAALEGGRPYAVAFIDVELPPGMNGVWAAERIRRLDPDVEIVIATAHATTSLDELGARVGPAHRLTYFRKPMHVAEIRQIAESLGARWLRAAHDRRSRRELEARVAALEADSRRTRAGSPAAPGAVVLVVEDEPVVRRLASRVLSRSGYTVLEAEDGETALRLADASDRPIDLVLTDVVMPDMNGRHLATAVQSRFPSARVIFMSGYATDELAAGALPRGARFLPKPFATAELADAVRATLAAGDAN